MGEAYSAIWQAAVSLLGLAVLLVLLWLVSKAHSRMWRLVSARYADAGQAPVLARKLETIVITRRGPLGSVLTGNANFRQYAGTVIAVTRHGLRLSLIPIPPLNLMCPALSLPFDQMKLERTSWALWPEPFAIRMTGLPDIDIIFGRDTVHWLRSSTNRAPFGC